MTSADQTSLDRYLLNNGHRLLGQPATQAGAKFQTGFGVVFTVASLTVMPFSFAYGWHIAVAMIGPLTAGVINLFVGVTLLKKSRGPESVKVALSPEARQLLASTLKQMGGWRMAWAQQSSRPPGQYGPWYEQYGNGAWGYSQPMATRSSRDVLNERAFELLDATARECNRIHACIAAGGSTAVQKRAGELASAADEGMAYVLQQASLLDRFPESGEAVEAGAKQQIGSLKEIAERLEALHTREPLLTDRLGSASAMDRVLDDLRLETLARQELTHDLSEERRQDNRS